MKDDNKANAEGGDGRAADPSSDATAASGAPPVTGSEAVDGTADTGVGDSAKRRASAIGANLRSFATKSKAEPKERPVDQIRVADGALASIIGLSAHEVPGVVGMAPASITEGIRRILGARQVDEGVNIEHPHGADRADVDLHVVVAYGVNIPVVADSIRERVRYAARSLAGIELDEVRVHVAGISRG